MNKLIFIFLFFIGSLVQSQQQDNPFFDAEKNTELSNANDGVKTGTDVAGKPGDPPTDPKAPIDDYIPLLIITALGIIIYKTRKNRNLLS